MNEAIQERAKGLEGPKEMTAPIPEEFGSHTLNVGGSKRVQEIKQRFANLLKFCNDQAPSGRNLKLVAMKLEEACFYAVKAVASNPENQEKPK